MTQQPSPLPPLRKPKRDARTALYFVQRDKSSGRTKSTQKNVSATAVAICQYATWPRSCSAVRHHRCRRVPPVLDEKVAGVRASTSDAPPPTFTSAPPGCLLLATDRRRCRLRRSSVARQAVYERPFTDSPIKEQHGRARAVPRRAV